MATVLNVLLKSLERRFKAPMITITTSVAIKAYSIAVAPESSIFSFFIILPITRILAQAKPLFPASGGKEMVNTDPPPGASEILMVAL